MLSVGISMCQPHTTDLFHSSVSQPQTYSYKHNTHMHINTIMQLQPTEGQNFPFSDSMLNFFYSYIPIPSVFISAVEAGGD